MGRLSDRYVVQLISDDLIVFVDDSSGQEFVMPTEVLEGLIGLLTYFRDSLATADSAQRDRAVMDAVDQRIQATTRVTFGSTLDRTGGEA
jgi:hypothetical protein